MDEPAAIGHSFNVANARPPSQAEVAEAFAKVCKKNGEIRSHPPRIHFSRPTTPSQTNYWPPPQSWTR
jgi:hypothetical protein